MYYRNTRGASRPNSREGGYNARRSFSSRPPQGGGRRNNRRQKDAAIDVSRFINKSASSATPTLAHVPKHAFADFAVDERLKANISARGFVTPTPIQDMAIPQVLEGNDIVGIANTGTGKTAAFLIPLLNKILKSPKEKVLIIAPTRELAQQINEECKHFAYRLGIWSVCVIGGESMYRQINDLRRPHSIVIGTPGRIKDLVERKALSLAGTGTIVLDEADRMLDMGFINDIRKITSLLPTIHHTLFFSATMSREIEGLISEFLRSPVTVSLARNDTSKNVDQDIVRIESGASKIDVLHDLLIQPEFSKVLVFGRTKHGVEKLSIALAKRGFTSDSIHGDKRLSQRQRALEHFKKNRVQVLVATDVAARGIDIADISHVINFDLPSTYEDYVHRIGRTGRGDKKGKALTFVE